MYGSLSLPAHVAALRRALPLSAGLQAVALCRVPRGRATRRRARGRSAARRGRGRSRRRTTAARGFFIANFLLGTRRKIQAAEPAAGSEACEPGGPAKISRLRSRRGVWWERRDRDGRVSQWPEIYEVLVKARKTDAVSVGTLDAR